MHFPKFDGDDPQYGMTCAQNYFDHYAVDPSMWVKCSTMQFTGAARRWFQSVERDLMKQVWPSFCRMIRVCFCRDQHEFLIRQLFHIKQTSTIQDYVDRFVDLVEQLSAYTPNPDHLYYSTRFIDGLRDDIRAIIIVQRPQDLDTACSLALWQEEALEPGRRRDVRRTDGFSLSKAPASKSVSSPGRPVVSIADDKRQPDDRRIPPRPPNVDEKLQTLRSYRKARGLCIRCGERWQPGHKCA